MSNYFPPTALIFEGFLNATKTGCSDWSPRIVWVLIEMYLLNSSKATWLDSCSALANTASCTEKFVLSENLACPWMGFMKIKDKKNYSFFFFFSSDEALCIHKVYINVGHILDAVAFYPHSIRICADTWLKMSRIIKKTEKSIIMVKILACINSCSCLLCF